MTITEKLTDWLDQPVYDVGIVLYEKLFGDGFVLTMLKTGPDDFNRDRLTRALRDKHTELTTQAQVMTASYPEPLVAQLDTGGLLMDERTILKDRMRTAYNSGITESPDLRDMAFRMLTIKDELDAIYGRKHFFEQNGFLPEAASSVAEAETAADLLRRRNSVRTYVTKYKKQLDETFDPAERTKVNAKLTKYQTELHNLQLSLDNLPPHVPFLNR